MYMLYIVVYQNTPRIGCTMYMLYIVVYQNTPRIGCKMYMLYIVVYQNTLLELLIYMVYPNTLR